MIKYTCNENFFENIDTEEKAYWLGFIAADGHVSKKNSIIIQLAFKDKSHIEKFKKSLNSNHIITDFHGSGYKKDAVSSLITIYSKNINNSLNKYGLFNDKTSSLRIPKLNDDLIRHFIRGYFDGDGGWSVSIVNNQLKISFGLTGNFDFIKEIKNIFITKLNLPDTKLSFRKKESNYPTLRYCGIKSAIIIGNWLYKDSNIFMDRKFNKLKEIIKSFNEQTRSSRKVLNKEKQTLILRDYNNGTNKYQISKKYNISYSVIYFFLNNVDRYTQSNNQIYELDL